MCAGGDMKTSKSECIKGAIASPDTRYPKASEIVCVVVNAGGNGCGGDGLSFSDSCLLFMESVDERMSPD